MPRYKLTTEYDGGPFVGFQRQANGPSVQAALESAIKGFCGEDVTVIGAGRTDAGVHALAQVVHFDLEIAQEPDTIRDALYATLIEGRYLTADLGGSASTMEFAKRLADRVDALVRSS